jgi:hypothetical protein
MRKNSIWLLCAAVLLSFFIAAVPSGPISAQGCVDENGRPAECPKKRPTVVYPSFTPTKVPTLTATKVPSLTPTKVLAFTPTKVPSLTPTKVPAVSNQGRPTGGGMLLWLGGGLFGMVVVAIIIYLYVGAQPSTFVAEAHGDLNVEDEHSEFDLVGEVDSDDSVEGSAGIFDGPEDE